MYNYNKNIKCDKSICNSFGQSIISNSDCKQLYREGLLTENTHRQQIIPNRIIMPYEIFMESQKKSK